MKAALGPRRLVHVPVVRDVDLLLGPGIRNLTNLGPALHCRQGSQMWVAEAAAAILGREKEGTRAEVAACDSRRRGVDQEPGPTGGGPNGGPVDS